MKFVDESVTRRRPANCWWRSSTCGPAMAPTISSSWRCVVATPTPSTATASNTCCRRTSNSYTARVVRLRDPDGRIDERDVAGGQPDVIFTCFGDMMRVPGSSGSLLDAKARGADVRFVYSPLDALKIATDNPDKQVVFFAIGFETTVPSTAVTLVRAAIWADQFQCVRQPRHHRAADQGHPRFTRLAVVRLHRAGPRAHRCRQPALPIRAGGVWKPLVVAGFEPLDILASIAMLLTQIREGRCEVENQYSRVVPEQGGTAAFGADGQGVRAASALRMAGARFISQSALRLSDDFADFDAELRYSMPGVGRRPKACRCGEVLEGVLKALGMQGSRTACTSRLRSGRASYPQRAPARPTTTSAESQRRPQAGGVRRA